MQLNKQTPPPFYTEGYREYVVLDFGILGSFLLGFCVCLWYLLYKKLSKIVHNGIEL